MNLLQNTHNFLTVFFKHLIHLGIERHDILRHLRRCGDLGIYFQCLTHKRFIQIGIFTLLLVCLCHKLRGEREHSSAGNAFRNILLRRNPHRHRKCSNGMSYGNLHMRILATHDDYTADA